MISFLITNYINPSICFIILSLLVLHCTCKCVIFVQSYDLNVLPHISTMSFINKFDVKTVFEDVPLFTGLINDLFPGKYGTSICTLHSFLF